MRFMLGRDSYTADRYIEKFCEKSGTEPDYVKKWFPIAAAAMSVKRSGEEKRFLLEFAEKSINEKR